MDNKFDIVVFGATGYTGKFVICTLSKFSKSYAHKFTWGIAGRSEEKLKEALSVCGDKLGYSLNETPIIVADVTQEESLRKMARRTNVIINCCGPFGYFGEPVVKACLEEGTHHLDISAEIPYMEMIQLKYHQTAKKQGVYILSACAYESIPVDLGIVFLQQNFGGILNSVEVILEFWEEDGTQTGTFFNYSTWESAMYVFEHEHELQEIRRRLFPHKLPKFKPELKLKILPRKCDVVKGWVMPFDSIDRPVVQRSQRYFYERHAKRPIQIQTYFAAQSFTLMLLIMFFGIIVSILSKFSFGRKLLLKFPEKFSGGLINREAPSEDKTEKVRFCMTLHGQGWSEILPDVNHQHLRQPNKTMTAKVSGCNPGYGGTAVMLVLAGLTLVTEKDNMPATGGVYPPGYAFARTSLVEQLNKHGINFQLVDAKT